MDVIEAIDKLSVIVNTEELKQSVHVACELRERIAANQGNAIVESSSELRNLVRREQVLLAQQLHIALTTLQVLAMDNASVLVSEIGDQMLHRIAEIAIQLDEDLNAVIARMQIILPQGKDVNETVQEKIIELVMDNQKEQVAPIMDVSSTEILREELLSATGICDGDDMQEITAIDRMNVIEELPNSEGNVLVDKQADLINVTRTADEKIIDHSEVITIILKYARSNGQSARYCFMFLENLALTSSINIKRIFFVQF